MPHNPGMAVVISPDHYIFDQNGVYTWTPGRAKRAWDLAYKALKDSLREHPDLPLLIMSGIPGSGKSTWLAQYDGLGIDGIAFDATFTRAKDRVRIINTARRVNPQVRICCISFKTPFELCRERNNARSKDRKVPEESMDRMISAITKEPPAMDDGFDALYEVHPQGEGNFYIGDMNIWDSYISVMENDSNEP
jgi:hypothetical protein